VAEDISTLHGGDEAVVDVKIGAADCGGRHLYDAVLLAEDLGIGNLFYTQIFLAIPTVGFHEYSSNVQLRKTVYGFSRAAILMVAVPHCG
jgi:hypothetical protein